MNITQLSRTKKLILIGMFIVTDIFILLSLYVASFVHAKTDVKADVAIVLGAKSYKGNSYNPCLVSRVKEAVLLYNNNQVPSLLFTGGNDKEDGKNEAETMKQIALEQGASESAIILEKEATSTYENLVNSKKILDQKGINNVIIISEPFHIARTKLIAQSLGMHASYQAASDSPCWNRWKYLSRYFLKEPISILFYALTGKIKFSTSTLIPKPSPTPTLTPTPVPSPTPSSTPTPTVYIDKTPPKITLKSPINTTNKWGNSYAVSFISSEPMSASSVLFNGQEYPTHKDSFGNTVAVVNLSIGENIVTIKATDTVGNTGNTNFTITMTQDLNPVDFPGSKPKFKTCTQEDRKYCEEQSGWGPFVDDCAKFGAYKSCLKTRCDSTTSFNKCP